jgi:hypothetical protein
MRDHYALFFESCLILFFIFAGLGFCLGVMAPLLHAVAHAEHLALKPGAGRTGEQVQAQRDAVTSAQGPVFAGDEQCSRFFAGPSEWHHG